MHTQFQYSDDFIQDQPLKLDENQIKPSKKIIIESHFFSSFWHRQLEIFVDIFV